MPIWKVLLACSNVKDERQKGKRATIFFQVELERTSKVNESKGSSQRIDRSYLNWQAESGIMRGKRDERTQTMMLCRTGQGVKPAQGCCGPTSPEGDSNK